MEENTELLTTLSRNNISTIVIKRITDAIVEGRLKPGDKIPTEQEFAQQLGVGRNVIREAIKVLEAFGVVEIRRSEGTFVSKGYNQNILNPLLYGLILTSRTKEDLLAFRISLLHSTLFMDMRNATDAELTAFYSRCQEFKNALTNRSMDREHIYLLLSDVTSYRDRLCHNPMMAQLTGMSALFFHDLSLLAVDNSFRMGLEEELGDSYMMDADVLQRRAMSEISACVDRRMNIWRTLVL